MQSSKRFHIEKIIRYVWNISRSSVAVVKLKTQTTDVLAKKGISAMLL